MEPEVALAWQHRPRLKGRAVPTPGFLSVKPREGFLGGAAKPPNPAGSWGEASPVCWHAGLGRGKYLGTALRDWRGRGAAVPAAETPKGEALGMNTLGQEKAPWFGGFRG